MLLMRIYRWQVSGRKAKILSCLKMVAGNPQQSHNSLLLQGFSPRVKYKQKKTNEGHRGDVRMSLLQLTQLPQGKNDRKTSGACPALAFLA